MEAALDRVWILGGAGFIGSHLARATARDGVVAGLGISDPTFRPQAHGYAGWSEGPIDRNGLETLANSGLPRTIYFLAGGSSVGTSMEDPDGEWRKTVPPFRILLDWLRDRAPTTSVVLTSSAAVYGDGHAGAIAEGATTHPASPYGQHKLELERALLEAGRGWGLRSAVVRLFSIYGPGLQRQILWDIFRRSKQEQLVLFGTGDERRDFLHIDDAVEALRAVSPLATVERPIWNGGTGVGRCVRDIARDWLAALASPSHLAFDGQTRPGDPASLVADARKLQQLVVPRVDWLPSLKQLALWYQGIDAGRVPVA